MSTDPAPAPEAPPTRSKQALAVGAAVVVVAAAAGFFLGRRDGEGRAAPKAETRQQIRSGPFALQAPARWREPSRPAAVPGLALTDRVELSPSATGTKGTLIVGVAPADDRSLLPATLVPHLRPSGAARLADLQALRYGALRPLGGDGPIDVYAAPTTRGVLTGVCAGADPGFLRSCRAAVATLRMTRGESYALGPDRALRDALDRAMSDLNDVRRRSASAMESARRPERQADAANAIAAAYAAAVRRVEQAGQNPTSADARIWLAFALGKAEVAWSGLARAARAGDAAGYRSARAFVMFSERWAALAAVRAGQAATAPAAAPFASPPPEPGRPLPPGSSGPCSPTHSAYGRVPDDWKFFAKMCANDDGTSVLVENLSNVVLIVEHDGRARDVTKPPDSLSGVVTAEFARDACLGASCHLYPGTSVRIDAAAPVHVDFALAFNDTVTVATARQIAAKVEARLRPRAQRAPRQILECASGVVSTFQGGDSWEEVVRKAAPTVSGCTGLADEFREPGAQERPKPEPLTLTPPDRIARVTKAGTNPALATSPTLAKNPMLAKNLTRARGVLEPMAIEISVPGLKVLWRLLPRVG